ncbi:hypothetical protein ACRFB9_27895, partial [Klebsiella pneumoniae]
SSQLQGRSHEILFIQQSPGDLHFCSTPAAVALFDNSFNALSKVGRKIKNEAARKAFFDCIYSRDMLGLSGGKRA